MAGSTQMDVIEQKDPIRCHYTPTRMIRRSGIEDADLSSCENLTGLRSEHQHLVGRHRPFAQQRHVAGLHPLDESLRPDPAGLEHVVQVATSPRRAMDFNMRSTL